MPSVYSVTNGKGAIMDLYEFYQVQGDRLKRNTPIIKDGVKDPFNWLWAKVNDVWQPMKIIEELYECNCIGSCAKQILPDNMKCELEEFNRIKH